MVLATSLHETLTPSMRAYTSSQRDKGYGSGGDYSNWYCGLNRAGIVGGKSS
jgi:hypothetical protein